jgi:hypothetical protein
MIYKDRIKRNNRKRNSLNLTYISHLKIFKLYFTVSQIRIQSQTSGFGYKAISVSEKKIFFFKGSQFTIHIQAWIRTRNNFKSWIGISTKFARFRNIALQYRIKWIKIVWKVFLTLVFCTSSGLFYIGVGAEVRAA